MTLTVRAVPPFDFDLSAMIFSEGDRQIRRYEAGRFWQVIRANGKLVLITVKASGTAEKPAVSVEPRSDRELSTSDRKTVGENVRLLFNLDLDLKPFYECVKDDAIMAWLTRRFWGLKSPTTATVFEALVDSIVEQQISLNVAHMLQNRMIRRFGDELRVDGEVYFGYPTPERLAPVAVGQLRDCGLTQKKAEYVKNASRVVTSGQLDLEKLKAYEDTNAIIRELDEIRGIGVWTAELTIVRSMQKLNALPADDIALKRAIGHYYRNDRKINSQEARQIAGKWGNWKGLAGYYLEMAERSGIEPEASSS